CQEEDGIREDLVTGVQTCALPISPGRARSPGRAGSRFLSRRGRRAGSPPGRAPAGGSGATGARLGRNRVARGRDLVADAPDGHRSEERRGGKAGRSRGAAEEEKKE